MESRLTDKDFNELGFTIKSFTQGIPPNKIYYRDANDVWGITARFNFYKDNYPNMHIYKIEEEIFRTFFSGRIENKAELIKVVEQVITSQTKE